MRDLALSKETIKLEKQRPISVSQRKKNVTCFLDEFLLTKLKNLVNQQKFAPRPKFYSVSELIRQALVCYKDQELKIDSSLRKLGNPRISYTFSLTPDLCNFYKT